MSERDLVNDAFSDTITNVLTIHADRLRISPRLTLHNIISYCAKYPDQAAQLTSNVLAANGDVEKIWDRYIVPLLMLDFFRVSVFSKIFDI